MNRQRLGEIYAKSDGHCWYCGISLPPFSDWEIEHQTPRSQGGPDTHENLVASCRNCNSHKGARTVEQYRHSLLVKLEHQITSAVEYCYELSAAFGSDPSMWMPEPLLRIHDELSELAERSTRLHLSFYEEQNASAKSEAIQ